MLDKSPEDGYFPSCWYDFRRARIAKTFDECDHVNKALWFLRKGLEKYENLQRHCLNRCGRRGKYLTAYLDSDLDSDSKSDEAEATWDDAETISSRGAPNGPKGP
jgi:hypothetical protein